MEAKDTVMKPGDLCLRVCQDHRTRTLEGKDCNGLDCEECQLEAQAEISYKAGYDGALAQLAEMTEECKQMGRREVVEWMKEYYDERSHCFRIPDKTALRPQLKRWGIE